MSGVVGLRGWCCLKVLLASLGGSVRVWRGYSTGRENLYHMLNLAVVANLRQCGEGMPAVSVASSCALNQGDPRSLALPPTGYTLPYSSNQCPQCTVAFSPEYNFASSSSDPHFSLPYSSFFQPILPSLPR